jgi:uncharacterized protein YdiU (UPF0061 family)
MQYRPSTRHADLGPEFFDIVAPAAFPTHILRYRNQPWAARVGLDGLSDEQWVDNFGRFVPLPGSFPQPLALRYHGHQFRSYNPELGDGRGFLYAQLHDLRDGRLLDFGTKGSGTTPWSRTADGRLTLKGGVREVLATSMLEALGVYTSKSFSLIETGEQLYRGDEPSPTRASVLVRLSHTHIRIGSFQRLSYLEDKESLLRLLDHAIAVAMPEMWREDVGERACAFLGEVCARVARMGAQWMAAGFVHGVLNTDNINITGESFDYGPWRFLPQFDPSPRPISTITGSTPSVASRTHCCGTWCGLRNACCRLRKRQRSSRFLAALPRNFSVPCRARWSGGLVSPRGGIQRMPF